MSRISELKDKNEVIENSSVAGVPEEELSDVDVPLYSSPVGVSNVSSSNISDKNKFTLTNDKDYELSQYSPQGIKNIIDYHDNMDRHKYKRYGFWMIVGALSAFLMISILDSILLNRISEYKTSSVTEGFVDLLKYIIPTLIGFVFADSKGNKSKSEDKNK